MTNHENNQTWIKDFNGWNHHKQKLNKIKALPSFQERDIWRLSIGTNVGSEVDGKSRRYERPVVILRKFSGGSFLGVPMTSRKRTGSYYAKVLHNGRSSYALLSQVRVFDARRLLKRMYQMDSSRFYELVASFTKLLPKPIPQ